MDKTQSRKVAKSQSGKKSQERPKMLQWTTGTWKGLPLWQCGLCPWNTLEGEEAMLEHIRVAHTPKPPRKITLPFVDAKGRPIEVEEDGAD